MFKIVTLLDKNDNLIDINHCVYLKSYLTNNMVITDLPNIISGITFTTIKNALLELKKSKDGICFIVGSADLVNKFIWHELIRDIHLGTIDCVFKNHFGKFDRELLINNQATKFEKISSCLVDSVKNIKIRHFIKKNYEEIKLLNTMNEIIETGFNQNNRTNVKTKAVFGKLFEYKMVEKIINGIPTYRFPLLTTKKMFTRGVFAELKWFLNGSTNSKLLENQGVNIWKGNSSKEYLQQYGFKYDEGECGPIYGYQWRNWNGNYKQGKLNDGIDQVNKVINSLKTDPFSRRHIITGWNVEQLDDMVLPPCFVRNTLVLTKNGYKAIQTISDNDEVLTHLGNWKPIINKQERMYNDKFITIKTKFNSNPITCTKEHPFLVKSIISDTPYKLSETTNWIASANLNPYVHLLCIPINKNQEEPNIQIFVDNKETKNNEIDWFMVGIYVGKNGNIFDLKFVPPGWSILNEFVKKIPTWFHNLKTEYIQQFINGFKGASAIEDNVYLVNNELLALDLQRLFAKTGTMVSIHISNSFVTLVETECFYDLDYIYVPIESISESTNEEYVYNLEIADDNSYTVDNYATHNCHVLYQFMVHEENNQKYVSLMMTQRSCDTFLGLPFNICSLGFFLTMIAHKTNMKPYKIIHSIADMHIYENHIENANKQISREPFSFPYIQVNCEPKENIEDYSFTDFKIIDYYSHDSIKADMVA
jgi:thymidylate synthase